MLLLLLLLLLLLYLHLKMLLMMVLFSFCVCMRSQSHAFSALTLPWRYCTHDSGEHADFLEGAWGLRSWQHVIVSLTEVPGASTRHPLISWRAMTSGIGVAPSLPAHPVSRAAERVLFVQSRAASLPLRSIARRMSPGTPKRTLHLSQILAASKIAATCSSDMLASSIASHRATRVSARDRLKARCAKLSHDGASL